MNSFLRFLRWWGLALAFTCGAAVGIAAIAALSLVTHPLVGLILGFSLFVAFCCWLFE